MNVLYTATFPADPERVGRVRSSIEQCLDASPLAPATHAEVARAAASLLALAGAWADAPGATVAVRIEATSDAYDVRVDATRASGATCAFSARLHGSAPPV